MADRRTLGADLEQRDELVGPASKIRPEMFTPFTSATFIVTLPMVGTRSEAETDDLGVGLSDVDGRVDAVDARGEDQVVPGASAALIVATELDGVAT